MAIHFAGDYFHYDNKFWKTIKALFINPGQITLDFINGKRVKYLNPISLYIFVTTLYVVCSHLFSSEDQVIPLHQENKISNEKPLPPKRDSIQKVNNKDFKIEINSEKKSVGFRFSSWSPKEKNTKEYDSVQHTLSKAMQDGFIKKAISHKFFKIDNDKNFKENFFNSFEKNLPKVFFILLPFFALLLKLIFYKKRLLFVDHLIFSIHFHTMGFLFAAGNIIIEYLYPFGDSLLFLIGFLFTTGLLIYLYVSLKKVYPSSSWKIILKQILLLFSYFVGLLISIFLILLVTLIFY